MCIYTLSVSVQPVPQSSFGVTMAAVFQTPRNVMVLMTDITSSDEQGCGRYHTILHEVVMDIKLINVWLILPCHLKSYNCSLLYCFRSIYRESWLGHWSADCRICYRDILWDPMCLYLHQNMNEDSAATPLL